MPVPKPEPKKNFADQLKDLNIPAANSEKLNKQHKELSDAGEAFKRTSLQHRQDRYDWVNGEKDSVSGKKIYGEKINELRKEIIKKSEQEQKLYRELEAELRKELAKVIPLTANNTIQKKAWIDEQTKNLLGDDKETYDASSKTLFIAVKNKLNNDQKQIIKNTLKDHPNVSVKWIQTKPDRHWVCKISCSGSDPATNKQKLLEAMKQIAEDSPSINIRWGKPHTEYKEPILNALLGGERAKNSALEKANKICNEHWQKFHQEEQTPAEENDTSCIGEIKKNGK